MDNKKLNVSDLENFDLSDVKKFVKSKESDRITQARKDVDNLRDLLDRLSIGIDRFQNEYSDLFILRVRREFIGDTKSELMRFLRETAPNE